MKLGVLTGVDVQHRYFARRIHEAFGVGAVIHEAPERSGPPGESPDLTAEENRIVADHYAESARQQERSFGPWSDILSPVAGVAIKKSAPGHLSGLETVAFLGAAGVDTLAVFGTSLIGPPLLTRFAGRCINLLPGLAPYYRATRANLRALVDERPECVGATIHLIDSGVNTGPVFAQVRPDIEAIDGPNVIFCKAVAAGIEAMVDVLQRFAEGQIRPVPQWPVPDPRRAAIGDFHPRQVVDLYRKVSSGMMRRYAAHAARRNACARIVELTPGDPTRASRP
jgi:hypothetical protein